MGAIKKQYIVSYCFWCYNGGEKMNIEVSHTALKYLKKLDKKRVNRIMNAIKNLPDGDVKKLRGSDKYRLRIGSIEQYSRKTTRIYSLSRFHLVGMLINKRSDGMNDFVKVVKLLNVKNQNLVCNFIRDLSISYDPDWVNLTDEEKRELEFISENDEFISFEDAMKELKHE